MNESHTLVISWVQMAMSELQLELGRFNGGAICWLFCVSEHEMIIRARLEDAGEIVERTRIISGSEEATYFFEYANDLSLDLNSEVITEETEREVANEISR